MPDPQLPWAVFQTEILQIKTKAATQDFKKWNEGQKLKIAFYHRSA